MSGQIFARTNRCTVPFYVYTGPVELDEFVNAKVCKFGTYFCKVLSVQNFVRTRVNGA